jgi:hypothetical protein
VLVTPYLLAHLLRRRLAERLRSTEGSGPLARVIAQAAMATEQSGVAALAQPGYSKRITVMTTEIDIHAHLLELHAERALASIGARRGLRLYLRPRRGDPGDGPRLRRGHRDRDLARRAVRATGRLRRWQP